MHDGCGAERAERVHRTAAHAVALAGLAAGGRALILADAVRVRGTHRRWASRRRGGPAGCRTRKRPCRPSCSRRRRRRSREAVVVLGALGARHALAAAAGGVTRVVVRALRLRAAAVVAGALAGVARERRADHRRAGPALAAAVANADADQRRALTGPGRADAAGRVVAALAGCRRRGRPGRRCSRPTWDRRRPCAASRRSTARGRSLPSRARRRSDSRRCRPCYSRSRRRRSRSCTRRRSRTSGRAPSRRPVDRSTRRRRRRRPPAGRQGDPTLPSVAPRVMSPACPPPPFVPPCPVVPVPPPHPPRIATPARRPPPTNFLTSFTPTILGRAVCVKPAESSTAPSQGVSALNTPTDSMRPVLSEKLQARERASGGENQPLQCAAFRP